MNKEIKVQLISSLIFFILISIGALILNYKIGLDKKKEVSQLVAQYKNYKSADYFISNIAEDKYSSSNEKDYDVDLSSKREKDKDLYPTDVIYIKNPNTNNIKPISSVAQNVPTKETPYTPPSIVTTLKIPENDGNNGTRERAMELLNESLKYPSKDNEIFIIATAYTSSFEDCGKTDGITASMTKAKIGTVAAPKDIPFNTKLTIDNFGTFNVEDRGGSIVRLNSRAIIVDVWFPTTEDCLKFGVRFYKAIITK